MLKSSMAINAQLLVSGPFFRVLLLPMIIGLTNLLSPMVSWADGVLAFSPLPQAFFRGKPMIWPVPAVRSHPLVLPANISLIVAR